MFIEIWLVMQRSAETFGRLDKIGISGESIIIIIIIIKTLGLTFTCWESTLLCAHFTHHTPLESNAFA